MLWLPPRAAQMWKMSVTAESSIKRGCSSPQPESFPLFYTHMWLSIEMLWLCAGNCSEAFHVKGICKLDVHKAENGGSRLGEGVWHIFRLAKKVSEITLSCPTLCNPMDCSLWGSSGHGIFQARILEWVPISFSRGYFQPRDWTQVSRIVGRHFTIWAIREVQVSKTNDKRAIVKNDRCI